MRGDFEKPDGLVFIPDFLSEKEEQKLLSFIQHLSFNEFKLFDNPAKRTVKSFGYNYSFETRELTVGDPFPKELIDLSNLCAQVLDVPPYEIFQCLVSKYPPQATIGWHTDVLAFGSKVIGISLASPCVMRFQRKENDKRKVFEIQLPPRSLYLLSKEARYKWQHSIPPTPALRYSITFRTLKN